MLKSNRLCIAGMPWLLTLLLLGLSVLGSAEEALSDKTIFFDIPRQRADLALTKFAQQADLTLVFPDKLVRKKTTNRLVGKFSREEAIKVLLQGTGLKPRFGEHLTLSIEVDKAYVEKIYYPQYNAVIPVFRVGLRLSSKDEAPKHFGLIFSARDGKLLQRRNYSHQYHHGEDNVYHYRVFADEDSGMPQDGPDGFSEGDFRPPINVRIPTPPDGQNPVMQQYLYVGEPEFSVSFRGAGEIDLYLQSSRLGSKNYSIKDVPVVIAKTADGGNNLCQTLDNNAEVANKVLIGNYSVLDCSRDELYHKLRALSLSAIIIFHDGYSIFPEARFSEALTYGVIVSDVRNHAFERAVNGGGVTATMTEAPAIIRDSTMSNIVVSHEWGHYLQSAWPATVKAWVLVPLVVLCLKALLIS